MSWKPLNPAEKGRKYSNELKSKLRVTNDGEVKTDAAGVPLPMTDVQRSYRQGYLAARSDNAKAYKYNKEKKKKLAKEKRVQKKSQSES